MRVKVVSCIGVCISALFVAGCGHQGVNEDGVRAHVKQFMSFPGAPVQIAAVPSCSKDGRRYEWQCRVRAFMPSTGKRFELTVIASCTAKRCELARNDWSAYAPANAPWKAVIDDWYKGGIDHAHSCAAVKEAIDHLPVDAGGTVSTARSDLEAYEREVC